MRFSDFTKEQLSDTLARERARYDQYRNMGLKLDISRGKPSTAQLDLSQGLFDVFNSKSVLKGVQDYRNYGCGDGIPEMKAIFAELAGVEASELIVAGNSSLNLMYDTLQRAMQFGVLGGVPFNRQGKIKWLCPVPGYDRHFAVTELFGIELVNVPMLATGPDMDAVESLVENDPCVKGVWCVPKYSNPQGITYSDETVKRFANLKPAAKDFRIYWDNAYMVHRIADEDEYLSNIMEEAKKSGNEDIVYLFGSTSKITFAGGGVAFIGASAANIASLKKLMNIQTIGPDKINQFAHAQYFKNAEGIRAHMQKHAALIRPKFQKVLEILEEELGGTGIAEWLNPNGGYFISCDLIEGTANRTVSLAKEAGVIFTPAGSTFPYMKDPKDSNVRLAPTLPPVEELETAMRVFCVSAKIAAAEKLSENA